MRDLRLRGRQNDEQTIPSSITDPILNLLRETHNGPTFGTRLNTQIVELFADGIKAFCSHHGILLSTIDCVGTHTPSLSRYHTATTVKTDNRSLGWNGIIQEKTGLTTIHDFTIMQGKVNRPLTTPVSYVDRVILRHPVKFRACLNIDDLSNISFISASAPSDSKATMSRNCGPGILFIDYATRYCTSNSQIDDRYGNFAANGTINHSIVDRFLNSHDYLALTPPLHMAREMFGDHEAQRLIDECLFANMCDADILATISRITAQNILQQYRRLLEAFFPGGQQVDELFICGPGSHNANIVDYLEVELPASVITKPLDDIGIPGDANGAVCYAHLAMEALVRQTTRVSGESAETQDEVEEEVVAARIARGENWDALVERVRGYSGRKPLRVTKDVRIERKSNGAAEGR